MREVGLERKGPRRYKVTTDSPDSFCIAQNVLDRQSDVSEPNRVWTIEGWCGDRSVLPPDRGLGNGWPGQEGVGP